jgi:hypothetical protein
MSDTPHAPHPNPPHATAPLATTGDPPAEFPSRARPRVLVAPDRLHAGLREALHTHYARLRERYEQGRRQWRVDHPLAPGSMWTPESIGLPPRGRPADAEQAEA